MEEIVPKYGVEQPLGDENKLVQLLVWLPGVESSSQIIFLIEGPRRLLVHCPGRYRAEIGFQVDVESQAESVRFRKKSGILKAKLVVVDSQDNIPAASSSTSQQEDQEQQGEERRQQHQDSAQTPPPTERPASQSSSNAGEAKAVPAGPSHRPLAAAQPQPAQQQQQQPCADPVPPDLQATSPREQLDAEMYAAATQHSNREAAAEFYAKAQVALGSGEAQRAHRLLQKACKLEPGSKQYQAALQKAADGVAADSNKGGPSSSNSQQQQQQQQSNDGVGSNGSAGPKGGSEAKPQVGRQQVRTSEEEGQSKGAPGPHTSHQERQQNQHSQKEEEDAAASSAAEALTAAMLKMKADERAYKTRVTCIVAVALLLACLCGAVLSLHWLLRLAPPAAQLTDAEGGWKEACIKMAGPLIFFPRVLLWQPTRNIAALWVVAAGCVFATLCIADSALARIGTPSMVAGKVYVAASEAVWLPALWLACGGSWAALLGTVVLLLRPHLRMGVPWWAAPFAYCLPCLAVSQFGLALPWRLVVWAYTGARSTLVLVWYHFLWQPSWLACLAFMAGGYVTTNRIGVITVFTCWGLGGGWWTVAHFTTCAAGAAASTIAKVWKLPDVQPRVQKAFRDVSPAFFLAKLLVGLVWTGWDWWTLVTGLVAGALLADVALRERYSRGGQRKKPASGSPAATQHLHNDVPAGAPAAVAAILKAGNYYEVLGLEAGADEALIKSAKRKLSLATHPDKIGDVPGAKDAFNLVIEASDMLGDAAARRQYDAEMADSSFSSGFNFSPEDLAANGIPPEFADRLQEYLHALDHGDIPQHCEKGHIHFMRRTDRPMAQARQCDECGTRHAVRQEEVWFEAAHAGFLRRSLHMYCCYKGVVYDMSESAECDGLLRGINERGMPLNTHMNFFKGFGLSTGGGGRGNNKKGRGSNAQASRGPGQRKKGRRR